MRLLLLLPLLVGCAQSEQVMLQQTLDEYAKLSSQSDSLVTVLTGEALASAENSAQLLEKLGISQTGLARFEVSEAVNGLGRGCLDMSEVELVDAQGELIIPSRPDRVEFEAGYEQNFLISSLFISEQSC
jgi:hypothetical protein